MKWRCRGGKRMMSSTTRTLQNHWSEAATVLGSGEVLSYPWMGWCRSLYFCGFQKC